LIVHPSEVRPRIVEHDRSQRWERAAPGEAGSEVPTNVTVTIGRIEVRAIAPPAEPPRPRASTSTVMALEDYLRRRSGDWS
jgi:hypothetical protein